MQMMLQIVVRVRAGGQSTAKAHSFANGVMGNISIATNSQPLHMPPVDLPLR